MRPTIVFASLLALFSCTASAELPLAHAFTATEPGEWINSPPLSLTALRGLVDRQGRVAATAVGELHEGEARAERFEVQLRALLEAPR